MKGNQKTALSIGIVTAIIFLILDVVVGYVNSGIESSFVGGFLLAFIASVAAVLIVPKIQK